MQSDDATRLRPTIATPWPGRPTAFEETMLGLEYDPARPAVDLFSGACVEMFEHRNPRSYDYPLAQVFEPAVLAEVAMLAGRSANAVTTLEYAPTGRVRHLREQIDVAGALPLAEAANLAGALISISRFALAQRVLDAAPSARLDARGRFELAMLRFIISNRCSGGHESAHWFAQMRATIEGGAIPNERILDACTQAVVWYLKRKELSKDDFAWFARRGNELVTGRHDLSDSSLSSWYRGVAMVPAGLRHAASTRALMEKAKETAEHVLSRSGTIYDRHLLKTYYESSIKEYLYVNRDPAKAEKSAQLLIELDPLWSASWGEFGEMLVVFGRPAEAASAFDTAAELGPPYLRYHLESAGDLYHRLGDHEQAARRYYALSLFGDAPTNILERGMELSSDSSLRDHFAQRLTIGTGRS